MATHAQIAGRLLREAAKFFRNVAIQNEPLREQLNDNATVYDQVADLLEADPMGVLELSGDGPDERPATAAPSTGIPDERR